MTQISVTRALAQVKSLNDRIQRGTGAQFIVVSQGGKIAGKSSIQEAEQIMIANLQSVQDLIAKRTSLKSAIVRSNAVTTVVIAGKAMTVAEAIERKSSIIIEQTLLQQLRSQHNHCIAASERINVGVQERIDELLKQSYGRDAKINEADQQAVAGPYEARHKAALVDPNKLEEVIKKMQDELDGFILEVDFALSEVNAKTLIEG